MAKEISWYSSSITGGTIFDRINAKREPERSSAVSFLVKILVRSLLVQVRL